MSIAVEVPGLDTIIPEIAEGKVVVVESGADAAKSFFVRRLSLTAGRSGWPVTFVTSRDRDELQAQLAVERGEEILPERWITIHERDALEERREPHEEGRVRRVLRQGRAGESRDRHRAHGDPGGRVEIGRGKGTEDITIEDQGGDPDVQRQAAEPQRQREEIELGPAGSRPSPGDERRQHGDRLRRDHGDEPEAVSPRSSGGLSGRIVSDVKIA